MVLLGNLFDKEAGDIIINIDFKRVILGWDILAVKIALLAFRLCDRMENNGLSDRFYGLVIGVVLSEKFTRCAAWLQMKF